MAVSPPPTTTNLLLRNAGSGPSQVAHAETPLPPKPFGVFASPGTPSHFAEAPEAIINVSALIMLLSVTSVNGRSLRSTCVIHSSRNSVPKRSACLRNSRSEEHTSELQSRLHLVCRLLLEKKNFSIQEGTSRSP